VPEAKKRQPPKPHNSVHLDAEHIRELFDELDRRGSASPNSSRRTHVRWPVHIPVVEVCVHHAGGLPTRIWVACRNISSSGMSILHSSFLHKGTRVVASVPGLSGLVMTIEGTIVNCAHVKGICHELGIQFKAPIDIKSVVRLDPFEGGFILEKVDPETLIGSILYLDDSPLGQSLIKHFLRETSLRLRIASTLDEARKIIEEGVDLIISDYHVAGSNGAEFIASLRKVGVSTPTIFITSDNSDAARDKFAQAQAGAILTKPCSQDLLLRALAEFLLTGKGVGVTLSTLPQSHPGFAMLDRFVDEIRAKITDLERTITAQDYAAARTVVLQIAGIAPTMGFPRLAELAQAADRSLIATMSVEESMSQLSHLMRLCREIRAKPAA